jgi:hypothetical protein
MYGCTCTYVYIHTHIYTYTRVCSVHTVINLPFTVCVLLHSISSPDLAVKMSILLLCCRFFFIIRQAGTQMHPNVDLHALMLLFCRLSRILRQSAVQLALACNLLRVLLLCFACYTQHVSAYVCFFVCAWSNQTCSTPDLYSINVCKSMWRNQILCERSASTHVAMQVRMYIGSMDGSVTTQYVCILSYHELWVQSPYQHACIKSHIYTCIFIYFAEA